jgi:hypothetical protein
LHGLRLAEMDISAVSAYVIESLSIFSCFQ